MRLGDQVEQGKDVYYFLLLLAFYCRYISPAFAATAAVGLHTICISARPTHVECARSFNFACPNDNNRDTQSASW